jgi:hypothetical protein
MILVNKQGKNDLYTAEPMNDGLKLISHEGGARTIFEYKKKTIASMDLLNNFLTYHVSEKEYEDQRHHYRIGSFALDI